MFALLQKRTEMEGICKLMEMTVFAHCALQPSLLGRRVVQNYIYVLSIKRKDRDKL